MIPEQKTYFSTLIQRPSWLNARGGLDRSACVEVRLSEVRRLAGCVEIDRSQRDEKYRPIHITRPLPDERPARRCFGSGSRISTGTFTITAPMIRDLHNARPARRLAGDFRTARAPAMRPPESDRSRGRCGAEFRCRIDRANPIAWPPDENLDPNPNAPGSQHKLLGLPREPGAWHQQLRIERWVFPQRIQPAYYLICPQRAGSCRSGPPPLSTCGPGRKNPSTGVCPQRCLKLLLVQCTPSEYIDAIIAQHWIAALAPAPGLRAKHGQLIAALTNRYGLLFAPRRLLCPRCLNVRYGNNPETVRQGWRRRNDKPDTSFMRPEGAWYKLPRDTRKLLEWFEADRERFRANLRWCDRVVTLVQKLGVL